MKQFVGTKIIHARPMSRGEYNAYRGWTAPEGEDQSIEGYLVRYQPDGYESWSPKRVFEAAYRPADGLNFGLALEACKLGGKIARKGWSGKEQYVELGMDFNYCTVHEGGGYAAHDDIGSKALVFVGTRGRQVGWLASQADMLADDWMIVD